MIPPSRTKACTFPYCDGRMTLKVHETREGSPDGERFWECDRRPDHVEKARAEIATLWQRGFVRCILSGDGATCALILREDDRILKTIPMPDEL
jgi:hypothetical protein